MVGRVALMNGTATNTGTHIMEDGECLLLLLLISLIDKHTAQNTDSFFCVSTAVNTSMIGAFLLLRGRKLASKEEKEKKALPIARPSRPYRKLMHKFSLVVEKWCLPAPDFIRS